MRLAREEALRRDLLFQVTRASLDSTIPNLVNSPQASRTRQRPPETRVMGNKSCSENNSTETSSRPCLREEVLASQFNNRITYTSDSSLYVGKDKGSKTKSSVATSTT